MTQVNTVKKLTIKAIVGKNGNALLSDMGKTIAAVSGIASGYRVAISQYGESLGFQGQFVGVNMLTGEQFVSNEAFFPRGFQDTLEARFKNAPGMEVEFSAEVVVGASGNGGLAYIARPISTKEVLARHSSMLTKLVSETAPLLTLNSEDKLSSEA